MPFVIPAPPVFTDPLNDGDVLPSATLPPTYEFPSSLTPGAANVPLSEYFGEVTWDRYTTATAYTTSAGMGRKPAVGYPYALSTLNHIDLRTFNNPSDLLSQVENWTIAPSTTVRTLGPNSSFNNWRMLTVNMTNGTPVTLTSIAASVDLTQIGSPTTVFLQAAINGGLTDLNLTTSTLGLSSDGGKTWDTQTLAQCLETGTGIIHTPLSNFSTVEPTTVDGVQLHLVPTSSGTISMTGLRVVDPNYQPSSVVMDNWNGVLRQDIPFDGNKAEYPPVAAAQLPVTYYAANTGGSDDPQPIDATFSVIFNTGGNTGVNQFSLNMRQVGGTNTSQLLIQDQTQLQLSGPQPGIIETAEIPRHMSDFQGLPLSVMQGQSMLDLDAVAEHVTATYSLFQVTWGANPVIAIQDSLVTINTPYLWALPALTSFTNYMATFTLEENAVRCQVYSLDQHTLAREAPLFDSGSITDSYQFSRRPGRIGWTATFTDGEAHLVSIRPERTLFAEYQSAALNSRTPVQGAQLYATFAPDAQLWTDFTASSNGTDTPIVTADTKRSITGSSTKVYVNEPTANQGVISNLLSLDTVSGITEWAETTINFSVWVPGTAAVSNSTTLGAYLISDTGWSTPLSVPAINYDTWQEITFDGPAVPSGLYSLQIVYLGKEATTFWVDAVTVSQRLLSWSARANPTDPWVPFNGLISDPSVGVMLNRGTQLQVRAQAKRQDAAILAKPKVKPVFAQLGKAVWPEDVAAFTDSNTLNASFVPSSEETNRTYQFTPSSTPATAPYVAQWLWQFSDGTIITGPSPQHSFSALAPNNTFYQITLTVVDIYGARATSTQTIPVP
jgi:hypothetical protein